MKHDTDIAAELRSLAGYAYVGTYVRERLLRAAAEIVRLREVKIDQSIYTNEQLIEFLRSNGFTIKHVVGYSNGDIEWRLSPIRPWNKVIEDTVPFARPVRGEPEPGPWPGLMDALARGNELMDEIRDAECEAIARRGFADLDDLCDGGRDS